MLERELNQIGGELHQQHIKAHAAVGKKNFDYAILILVALLKREPGCFESRLLLRVAQFERAKGSGLFKKLLGAAAHIADIIKAQLALRREQYAVAMQHAEEVLNVHPDHSMSHRVIAKAATSLYFPRTAIASLQLLRKQSPGDKKTYSALAAALETLGDYGMAEDVLRKMVELHPDDMQLLDEFRDICARATLERGGYSAIAKGEGTYRDALADPAMTKALEQQEMVVKSPEVIGEMIARKEAELQATPENLKIGMDIAKLYLDRGDVDRAIEYYQFVKANSLAKDPAIDRAITNAYLTGFDQRRAQLDVAAPDYAEHLAELEAEQREYQITDLAERVRSYPMEMELRYQYGELSFQMGRLPQAIESFQRTQSMPTLRIRSLAFLGQCFTQRGMLDLAENSLVTGIAEKQVFDVLKKEMTYNLGCVLELAGRPDEAQKQFKHIYELDVSYKDVAARVDAFYAKQRGGGTV
ncbi:MAG: hypothetical protein EXS24_00990 [Pedosphaera sp.]|nr:hypothetical protein [Pedosphaera sp.]